MKEEKEERKSGGKVEGGSHGGVASAQHHQGVGLQYAGRIGVTCTAAAWRRLPPRRVPTGTGAAGAREGEGKKVQGRRKMGKRLLGKQRRAEPARKAGAEFGGFSPGVTPFLQGKHYLRVASTEGAATGKPAKSATPVSS